MNQIWLLTTHNDYDDHPEEIVAAAETEAEAKGLLDWLMEVVEAIKLYQSGHRWSPHSGREYEAAIAKFGYDSRVPISSVLDLPWGDCKTKEEWVAKYGVFIDDIAAQTKLRAETSKEYEALVQSESDQLWLQVVPEIAQIKAELGVSPRKFEYKSRDDFRITAVKFFHAEAVDA